MKSLRILANEAGGLSTLGLVKLCLNHPPAKGYAGDLSDMKVRLDLLDKAEAAEASEADALLLEDTEAKGLVGVVNAMVWGKADRGIVTFRDAVQNMPTVDVKAV